jgi:hypothetical protein
MAMLESVWIRKLVLLTVALALALGVSGCAAGPVGSHGVDNIPAFDTPDNG